MIAVDRSDVIALVKTDEAPDEYGVYRSTTTEHNVFCRVESVTRAEFFDAGRNGLNPEFKITVFAGDYDGEDTVIYRARAYGIYRTYRGKNDVLELYVERKGGVARGAQGAG